MEFFDRGTYSVVYSDNSSHRCNGMSSSTQLKVTGKQVKLPSLLCRIGFASVMSKRRWETPNSVLQSSDCLLATLLSILSFILLIQLRLSLLSATTSA